MPIVDALGAVKKHNVMQSTWGHLYPEPSSKHIGHITVAYGNNGNVSILDDEFPTLHGSPQRAHLVATVMDKYDLPYGLYRIHCTLWFFKSCNDMYLNGDIGRIIKPRIERLWIENKEPNHGTI